jgi:hypothetical protein
MLTVLVVVAHLGLFGLRSVTGRVNRLFDDVYLLVEGRARSRGVNGGADYAELVAVVGLDTGTILALGNVDDRVLVDVRLGVVGLRSDVGRMDG